MESGDLKVTVTPQYAGKVWGIYDKVRQEELLFSNRAHQPANIAVLKVLLAHCLASCLNFKPLHFAGMGCWGSGMGTTRAVLVLNLNLLFLSVIDSLTHFEQNWSPGIIGHSAFSETQVYLAQVNTTRGPMLRVYEFDRYNGSTWQVDMIIHEGTFLAHPRVTNPTAKDLRGYWWTCVAVTAKPTTRIFSPATHVAETR